MKPKKTEITDKLRKEINKVLLHEIFYHEQLYFSALKELFNQTTYIGPI